MCDTILYVIIPLGIKLLPVAEGLFMFGCAILCLRFVPLDMCDFLLCATIYGPHVFSSSDMLVGSA